MKKIIYLNASDIALFINKHKYEKSTNTVLKILKTQYYELYNNCIENNIEKEIVDNLQTNDIINTSINNHKSDIFELSKLKLENNSKEYSVEYESVRNRIVNDIVETTKVNNESYIKNEKIINKIQKDTIEKLNENITMASGTISETRIINKIETNMNIEIKDRNDKIKYIYIDLMNSFKLKIGGKVDGITDGKLVEVKKRKNKLFKHVPDYELIQVQTYLEMFDIQSCIFVEEYKNDSFIHNIERDNKKWENIKSELINHGNSFVDMLNNKDKMIEFIQNCI